MAGSGDRDAVASVERAAPTRCLEPKLAVADRLLFVWLYRLFPTTLKAKGAL